MIHDDGYFSEVYPGKAVYVCIEDLELTEEGVFEYEAYSFHELPQMNLEIACKMASTSRLLDKQNPITFESKEKQ